MNKQHFPAALQLPPSFHPATAQTVYGQQLLKEERLPFSIRVVQNEEDMRKAILIRHAAYSRHLPELGEKLKQPEALDYDSDVAILLAESKLDGAALGSMRIQFNTFRKLGVEQSVNLPAHLATQRLAEFTRLGIENGRGGRLVKLGLLKACYQYCRLNQIDWMIATARAPIDRQYEQMTFEDCFPGQGFIPMQHVGNIPHRVMALQVGTAPVRWAAVNHPLLGFFVHLHHPDICLKTRPMAPVLQLRPKAVQDAGVFVS